VWSGVRTGGGIAVGDAIWTLIAALAWSRVAAVTESAWAGRFAALVLVAMAIHIWRSPISMTATESGRQTDFWSALGCTLASPLTIASMAAVMASFGPHVRALPFVVGIALGSLAWWLLLSLGVSRGRHRISSEHTGWLSKASAILLLALALHSL
jgi:threonine/homoserine/homoserine lactone efflux protein